MQALFPFFPFFPFLPLFPFFPFDARRAAIFIAASTLTVALGGCASRRPEPQAPAPAHAAALVVPAFTTTLGAGAPLVGKIWQTASGSFVPPDAIAAAAARADFVLLGEKHDNPDHHMLQAAIVASMLGASKKPTVLFEMLEPSQDAALAAYRGSAAGLGDAVEWGQSGWPPWSEYQPIAAVALGAGLRMGSANLPHDVVRGIAHHGAAALPPDVATRLGLDRPLDAGLEASLDDELRGAHCGQLPEAMVAPMAVAQRARDGQMAERMLAEGAGSGGAPVVLIAGTGHARVDRGVPMHLREKSPAARVVSVAFLEVEPESASLSSPPTYAARFHASRLPFDFVWFTPRANDDDPCASFHVGPPPAATPPAAPPATSPAAPAR